MIFVSKMNLIWATNSLACNSNHQSTVSFNIVCSLRSSKWKKAKTKNSKIIQRLLNKYGKYDYITPEIQSVTLNVCIKMIEKPISCFLLNKLWTIFSLSISSVCGSRCSHLMYPLIFERGSKFGPCHHQ